MDLNTTDQHVSFSPATNDDCEPGMLAGAVCEPAPTAAQEAEWLAQDLARAFPEMAAQPLMRAQVIRIPADLPPGLAEVVSRQATSIALQLFAARQASAHNRAALSGI